MRGWLVTKGRRSGEKEADESQEIYEGSKREVQELRRERKPAAFRGGKRAEPKRFAATARERENGACACDSGGFFPLFG